MSYGRLTDAQAAVLGRHARGRVVHDLGAGTCELATLLATRLGAKKVIAVDENRMPEVRDPSVVRVQARFDELAPDEVIDFAFLSAPSSRPSAGLLPVLERAKTVAYVGKNTDLTMCGWPGLFRALARRAVLDYVPDRRNTLIVYGDILARPRPLRGEEYAGLNVETIYRALTYEEVESRKEWPS